MVCVKYHIMTEPELTPPTLSQSAVPYDYSFKSHAFLCLAHFNFLNYSAEVDNVFTHKFIDLSGALNLRKYQVQCTSSFLAILHRDISTILSELFLDLC